MHYYVIHYSVRILHMDAIPEISVVSVVVSELCLIISTLVNNMLFSKAPKTASARQVPIFTIYLAVVKNIN